MNADPRAALAETRKAIGSPARQADEYVEEHHETFARLGDRFFEELPSSGNQISSQVRNLQQVVTTATRFVEVEDFVKNQMGKGRGTSKPWQKLGDEVLGQLLALRSAKALEPGVAPGTPCPEGQQLQFRLRLARGWVRAVVSQYLYRFALQQMEGRARG